ncbi:hypothetical protein C3K47_18995 [Solitalea longa]|uniref:HNH nuclease domain-containing protein n=1 Tax=Solitalea longa TaxID=2079460 RepID=A0A2S4ZXS7_9SPHI|nr:HNH endonuclease domain-containing protein [Solitalea longa]POY34722.1 hypothetical protein C3K47_18995 [Solitalea longa]
MVLPHSNELPINYLSACFNNTSATYKYYWFLSILQEVENGNLMISKRSLFSRMISNAWFTVNYFHISFGKQDLIQEAIRLINKVEEITIDENKDVIVKILRETESPETVRQLKHFDKNVPHWFLSPWFPKKINETDNGREKRIYNQSKVFSGNCLYALYEDRIEINPEWKNYLTVNSRILKDFCLWNLTMFLQVKNPNIPDIANKLIKPAIRSSLTKQRTKYWDLVLRELGQVKCIYTGKLLTIGNYAVEHFIPYGFVSHDLIWNLIPADKSFNCSKSDKLPQFEKYYDPFFDLQKTAVEIISEKSPNNKLLEEYLTIFPSLESISKEKFKEIIQPLITIASNNGFEFLQL